MLTESQVRKVRPVRYPRKFFDGGGMYLLVAPTGGRYWRYNYRFGGKHKTLALGRYPDVPLAKARLRHLAAKQLLSDGIDPAEIKRVHEKGFGWIARHGDARGACLAKKRLPGSRTRPTKGNASQKSGHRLVHAP